MMNLSVEHYKKSFLENRVWFSPFTEKNDEAEKGGVRVYQNSLVALFPGMRQKVVPVPVSQGMVYLNKKSLIRWIKENSLFYPLPPDWHQKPYQDQLTYLCQLQLQINQENEIRIEFKNREDLISYLPTEILVKIFSYLKTETLGHVSRVCKRFEELTERDWKKKCYKHYPLCDFSDVIEGQWRKYYFLQKSWKKPPFPELRKHVEMDVQEKIKLTGNSSKLEKNHHDSLNDWLSPLMQFAKHETGATLLEVDKWAILGLKKKGEIHVWNREKNKEEFSFVCSSPILGIKCSNRFLIVNMQFNNTILVWDLVNSKLIFENENRPKCSDMICDDKRLIILDQEGISIFNLANRKLIQKVCNQWKNFPFKVYTKFIVTENQLIWQCAQEKQEYVLNFDQSQGKIKA